MTLSSSSSAPQGPDDPGQSLWTPILEVLPQGLLLLAPDGRFLRANPTALRLLDLDPATLPGLTLADSRWQVLDLEGRMMLPEDFPAMACLRSGSPILDQVLGLAKADGDTLWLAISALPLAGGGALVSFDDISDRHLTEAILAAHGRLVDLAATAGLMDILTATLDEAEHLTGSCIGFYHFVDRDQTSLTLQAWSTRTARDFCRAEGAGSHYPISRAGVWVEAFNSNAPVIHNDYVSLPDKKGMPPGHAEVKRELVVPVKRGGRVVAILGVGNKPFDYGPRDVEVVQRLADLAWDVADHKRAEEDLARSEAKFRLISENARDLIYTYRLHPKPGFEWVSPSCLAITGYSQEDHYADPQLGMKLVHPDDREKLAQLFSLEEEPEGSIRLRWLRRDGEVIWTEQVNTFQRDETGKVVAIQGIAREVTREVEALSAIQASEERFRTLFERMTEGYAHCRMFYEGDTAVDWEYLSVNPAFEALTGLRDAVGRKVTEIIPGIRESSRDLFDTYGRVARLGVPERFESYVAPLGIWFSISVFSPRPEEFVATFDNITERKLAEDALAASEAKARAMLETTLDGVWLVDSKARFLEVNDAACQMLGYTREELLERSVGDIEVLQSMAAIQARIENLATEGALLFESRHRTKDGREFPVEVSATYHGEGGQLVVYVRDISEREAARAALLQTASRLQQAVAVAGLGIWEWNPTTDRTDWYGEMFSIYGISPAAFTGRGRDYFAFTREDHRGIQMGNIDKAWAEGITEEAFLRGEGLVHDFKELCIVRPDGTERWTLGQAICLVDPEGQPLRMLGVTLDITERKRAEASLRQEHQRAEQYLQVAEVILVAFDDQARITLLNRKGYEVLGYEEGELEGQDWFKVCLPQKEQEAVRAVYDQIIKGELEPVESFENHILKKDGTQRLIAWHNTFVQDDRGRITGSLSSGEDITERRAAEEALRALDTIDRLIQKAGVRDLEGMLTGLGEALLDIFGCDRAWLFRALGPKGPFGELAMERTRPAYPGFMANGASFPTTGPVVDMVQLTLGSPTPLCFGPQGDHPLSDSVAATAQIQSVMGLGLTPKQGGPWLLGLHQCDRPRVWTDAEKTLFGQIGLRVTDALNSLLLFQELEQSEQRYVSIAENSPVALYRYSDRRGGLYYSPRIQDLLGHTPEALLADPQLWHSSIHPEDLPRVDAGIQEAISGKAGLDLVYRIRDASGQERWFHDRATSHRLPSGEAILDGVAMDITTLRQAEMEKAHLQTQLDQAQKMESLGNLAGGVAHDMNNVLSAILALANVHEAQSAEGTPLHRSMETIAKACLRGRTMVQTLLGFARHDLVEEKQVDLNNLIREQAELLARTTLQKVQLELNLQEGLHPVLGDPGALSHLLMNLSVNAVDAMPEGGRLTFRTRNANPGEVEVVVQDTGTGMTQEVLAKATDPFFTTKAHGKGTGLGLSLVYSTIKAHHGHLELQSEVGKGTTVTLRFPACASASTAPQARQGESFPPRAGRILVVDDDELVQASLAVLLETLGTPYEVVGSGEEALHLLEKGEPFDGVILDLNMPGLGGEATLPHLRALRPDLPVFLATGRLTQQAVDLAERTPKVHLLPKPFTLEELKVRLQKGGVP